MRTTGVLLLASVVVAACGGSSYGERHGVTTDGWDLETGKPIASAAPAPSSATSAAPASTHASTPVLRVAPTQAAPEMIAARHVLISWMGCSRAESSVVRTREQAMLVAKEVLKRARAGDDFARLVVEYSDEPGAAARGGGLGRFGRHVMAPEFEAAAFKLQPGEISDIVETSFGFHVIQRTE